MSLNLFEPQIAYATSTLEDPWPATFQANIFEGMSEIIKLFITPVMAILTVLGIVLVIVSVIKAVKN